MKNPPPEKEKSAVYNGRFNRGLSWLLARLKVQDVPHIKRIIVTVVGGTVLIFGLTMIVLPGQVVVIVAGLAILGTEYAWARRLSRRGRQLASQALSRTRRLLHRLSTPAEPPAAGDVPEHGGAEVSESPAPAATSISSVSGVLP